MLSAAPAFALTTKDDVVDACAIGVAAPSTVLVPEVPDPSDRSVPVRRLNFLDGAEGIYHVPPRLDHGFRLHLAENGGSPSVGDACKAAIANYIAGTGKTGVELDKLLGELAYELIKNLSSITAQVVTIALKEIAAAVGSPELKSTIKSVADDAADGTLQTKPNQAPSPANPSGQ